MEIKQSAKKEWANYLKAYGIIMVVIGHAGAPADISKLISLFHMPLFFFISGYFYKDEYVQNIWDFVKRRLKGLYLPSVIFGIGFVFLHNLFMDLNIYSDKMGYRGPSHYYTKEEIIAKSINVLKFKYSEEMAGVFWFFPALLFVFLIFITVSAILNKIKIKHMEEIRFAMVVLIMVIGNYAIRNGKILYFWEMNTAFIATAIFYFGYLYKKNESKIPMGGMYAILALILLVVNSKQGSISMVANSYVNIPFLLMNSFLGIYLTLYVSKVLTKKDNKLLNYIGANTIGIMILHFLSFKIVNTIQVAVYDYPAYKISGFPVLNGQNGWWIAYTFVGVFIPIICVLGYEKVMEKIKFKIKK